MTRTAILDIAVMIILCAIFFHPASAQTVKKHWIYFVDKGPTLPSTGILSKKTMAYQEALEYVHPRALARRAKVLPRNALVDAADLPLYIPYLRAVEDIGGRIAQQSRWMNAASFFLAPDQVKAVALLPFARIVRPVVILHAKSERKSDSNMYGYFQKPTSMDYGSSGIQAQAINVTQLHDAGITGRGVLVGMLDDGFRWREHEALRSRNVIAEHDFIQNDDTTANQAGDAFDQDSHGTLTMSVIGGYQPGSLIGPAFDADFILAKTEFLPVADYKWEEDNWAAGIEWMEGFGVDVVSSSLGYDTFVDSTSYSWSNGDFNGRTTVSAQASLRASRLGVVVCDAMGNEGNGDGITGTMLTPADADSIISVGAASFANALAGFSSTGPTNDGRIKPDVVAPGVGVYGAVTPGPNTYSRVNGTSLATPLVAGSAALLLSARPELTPIQVRDALRNTAQPLTNDPRFPTSPNNFTGWGLVNAFQASLSFGPIFSDRPLVMTNLVLTTVSITVISKFGLLSDSVLLRYTVGTDTVLRTTPMTLDSAMFFPTSGKYSTNIPTQTYGAVIRYFIDARDSSGQSYRSPAPFTGSLWQFNYGFSGGKPTSFALKQNYPNPFNPGTVIAYDLLRQEHVRLVVYNVLGEQVAVLTDELRDAGSYSVAWDGRGVPSGVYFYRLTTSSFAATKKMMVLR